MVQHPAKPIVVHEKMELIECAQHGSVETFEELLEKAPKDYLRSFEDETDGSSLLHYACRAGNIPIIRYIIASNFPIDRQSRQHGSTRLTPLMEATKAGKLKAVKLLLTQGATLPKLRCSLNKSAMDYATNEMKLEIRDHVLQLRHGQIPIEPLQALPPGLPAPIRSSSSIPKAIARPIGVSKPVPEPRENNRSTELRPSSQPPRDAHPATAGPSSYQMHTYEPPAPIQPQRAVEQLPLHRPMPASRAALLGQLNPEQHYTPAPQETAPFVPQIAEPASPANPTRQALLEQLNFPGRASASPSMQKQVARPAQAWKAEQSQPKQANHQSPPAHHVNQHHHSAHHQAHHNNHHNHVPTHHHTNAPHGKEVQKPAPIQQPAVAQGQLPVHHMPPNHHPHMHQLPQMPPHMQAPPMGFHPGMMLPPHMGLPPQNYDLPPLGPHGQHRHPHAPNGASPDLRKSASSGSVNENGISFVGAEDMFRLHPDFRGLPEVELVHELWNLVEALREEKQISQRQLADANAKRSVVDTNRVIECTICFEEENEPWAFVPCGHFSPCNSCTHAHQQWARECTMCKTPASNRVRIYFS